MNWWRKKVSIRKGFVTPKIGDKVKGFTGVKEPFTGKIKDIGKDGIILENVKIIKGSEEELFERNWVCYKSLDGEYYYSDGSGSTYLESSESNLKIKFNLVKS